MKLRRLAQFLEFKPVAAEHFRSLSVLMVDEFVGERAPVESYVTHKADDDIALQFREAEHEADSDIVLHHVPGHAGFMHKLHVRGHALDVA